MMSTKKRAAILLALLGMEVDQLVNKLNGKL